MKVAVSGKGGVGKTLIAGGLARGFVERGLKTIAIDADSSPNLGLTLGLSAKETRKIVPVSENKTLVESKTSTGYSGVYRLHFSVDDIVRDYSVVLDLEAGVEHIGRGTARQVDVLLIVADSNLKSLEIAKHIHDMAKAAEMKQLYLIGNRVMNEEQKTAIQNFADTNGLTLLAFVPFDQKVIEADMLGETPLKNKDMPAVKTIDNICELLIKKIA